MMSYGSLAEIYYGYRVNDTEEINFDEAKKLAEKAGISLTGVSHVDGEREIVMGKEITGVEIPDTKNITAEEFLQKLISIERTDELEKIEKILGTTDMRPQVLLIGRNKE